MKTDFEKVILARAGRVRKLLCRYARKQEDGFSVPLSDMEFPVLHNIGSVEEDIVCVPPSPLSAVMGPSVKRSSPIVKRLEEGTMMWIVATGSVVPSTLSELWFFFLLPDLTNLAPFLHDLSDCTKGQLILRPWDSYWILGVHAEIFKGLKKGENETEYY